MFTYAHLYEFQCNCLILTTFTVMWVCIKNYLKYFYIPSWSGFTWCFLARSLLSISQVSLQTFQFNLPCCFLRSLPGSNTVMMLIKARASIHPHLKTAAARGRFFFAALHMWEEMPTQRNFSSGTPFERGGRGILIKDLTFFCSVCYAKIRPLSCFDAIVVNLFYLNLDQIDVNIFCLTSDNTM